MTDFNGNPLYPEDKVIVAYNSAKTTKLKNGIVKKVDIKQVNMNMALIEYDGNPNHTSRVASWNIYKIKD